MLYLLYTKKGQAFIPHLPPAKKGGVINRNFVKDPEKAHIYHSIPEALKFKALVEASIASAKSDLVVCRLKLGKNVRFFKVR